MACYEVEAACVFSEERRGEDMKDVFADLKEDIHKERVKSCISKIICGIFVAVFPWIFSLFMPSTAVYDRLFSIIFLLVRIVFLIIGLLFVCGGVSALKQEKRNYQEKRL